MSDVHQCSALHIKNRLFASCQVCGVLIKINDGKIIPALRPKMRVLKKELDLYDIFQNMKNYTHDHRQVSKKYLILRRDLLDYIKQLTRKYKLCRYTFHLTVFLLDVLSHNEDLMYEANLELLAVGCFLLAGKLSLNKLVKFTENDPIVPRLNNFGTTGKFFHRIRDVRLYESMAIHMLGYKLDYFTPFHLVEFYLYNGFIFGKIDLPIEKVYTHIYEVLEYFVFDKKCPSFTPFQIATSCVVYVLELLSSPKDFFTVYNIKESEYIDCLSYLKEYLELLILGSIKKRPSRQRQCQRRVRT
jgi:hypothetical protein